MNKRITIFFVLAGLTSAFAQNVADLPANSFPFNLAGQTMMTFDSRYEGVKGTYMFLEEYTPGTVTLKTGKFDHVLTNYDAHTDNLLVRSEKMGGVMQVRKDMVTDFSLRSPSGEDFLFVKKSVGETPMFLLELVRDSVSLYCKVTKTIKKAEYGGAYNMSETRYDEFISANTYYFVAGSEKLQMVPNTRKGVVRSFPEFEQELSSYLKGRKLDFNNYGHMKMLFEHINGLKKSR
jgi:hypothetical protein